MASTTIFSLFIFLALYHSNAISDLDTLLKVKQSLLKVTPYNNKAHLLNDWQHNTSLHYCNFTGVTCNGASRVVSLNLTYLPLHGTLSPSIGLLDELVNITLAGANLTGPIPSEISSLTSLRLLNLSANNFSGEFPGNDVGKLSRLEFLDVYNNNLTGPVPDQLVGLENLTYVHLGGNFFYGAIPDSYSRMKKLSFLGLNGNNLSGEIPASLGALNKLKTLLLGYYNTFSGPIPVEFGAMSELEKLDAASCNISGEIPASLGRLRKLNTLFLQTNRISGEIPVELGGMVSLMSLDLSYNQLSGEIPASFSELRSLTLLSLFQNSLFGRIPPGIGELPHLEVLQVWSNNLTFELPPKLGSNGRLKVVDVAGNHFTGPIPPELCRSGNLKWLTLMDNALLGPIPEELGQCRSLQRLRLGNNQLNGTVPAGIFNLPEINLIELHDNLLSGELPASVSGDKLGVLDISNNFIAGEIPPAVVNWRSLQKLYLEKNRFSGMIPGELFGLKQLQNLNISANSISGEIPATIGDCSSLIAVDFSRNNLVGEIPSSVANVKYLQSLNLSLNSLTGEVPGEIGKIDTLALFDISYNDFYGRVPSGGRFSAFNFAGNPNLCFPHRKTPCPVYNTPDNRHKTMTFTASKLILLAICLTTLAIVAVLTLIILRKKRLEGSKTWKVERFQRLDFKAEDVIEWLKEENIIGKGGAGVVYRGSLLDGTDIAIKQIRKLQHGSVHADRGFSAEIATLGRIRHRNIVRLLGYVSNKETNLLVYEYMSNGSLGEKLHGPKGAHLNWEMRYKIAVEAAKGLCYLHHDCSPKIFHRDVKSNNILLDEDYEAHVADFGLAKFLRDGGGSGGGASECMSAIAGSYGYIAPEYAYTLKVDEKSDVYSFGVVLLELITGRKPVGEFGEGVDIVRWVKKIQADLSQPSDAASVLAIVDSRINGYQLSSVINMFKIAMLCVEDESSDRPTMREVVHMLTNPPLQSIDSPPSLI